MVCLVRNLFHKVAQVKAWRKTLIVSLLVCIRVSGWLRYLRFNLVNCEAASLRPAVLMFVPRGTSYHSNVLQTKICFFQCREHVLRFSVVSLLEKLSY